MPQKTSIEWTDFSANPLKYRDASGKIVWGCVKTSPGCAHCYSEAIAERFNRGGPFTAKTMAGLTPFLDETELRRMLTYKPLTGKRCFIGDMTDVMGEWVPDELLNRLFSVFEQRSNVTWQVLTKRAERMSGYLQWRWGLREEGPGCRIPARNIHCGVSVEDQPRADERIPHLLRCPAAVRFLSVEPLLGPVDIGLWTADCRCCPKHNNRWINLTSNVRADIPSLPGDGARFLRRGQIRRANSNPHGALDIDGLGVKPDEFERLPDLHWVIVGGESGPGARPMQVEWARSLVKQCNVAGVACFVKQFGSAPTSIVDRISHRGDPTKKPDGFYRCLNDRKGGDPSEWPEDLRVREWPHARSEP